MNLRFFSAAAAAVIMALAVQAQAVTDHQYNSIKQLGELNGVALNCKFLDETRRMKKALVQALPKRRQLGQAFDDITNNSFLAFIQAKSPCPDAAEFSEKVDTAIQALNAAFSTQQIDPK